MDFAPVIDLTNDRSPVFCYSPDSSSFSPPLAHDADDDDDFEPESSAIEEEEEEVPRSKREAESLLRFNQKIAADRRDARLSLEEDERRRNTAALSGEPLLDFDFREQMQSAEEEASVDISAEEEASSDDASGSFDLGELGVLPPDNDEDAINAVLYAEAERREGLALFEASLARQEQLQLVGALVPSSNPAESFDDDSSSSESDREVQRNLSEAQQRALHDEAFGSPGQIAALPAENQAVFSNDIDSDFSDDSEGEDEDDSLLLVWDSSYPSRLLEDSAFEELQVGEFGFLYLPRDRIENEYTVRAFQAAIGDWIVTQDTQEEEQPVQAAVDGDDWGSSETNFGLAAYREHDFLVEEQPGIDYHCQIGLCGGDNVRCVVFLPCGHVPGCATCSYAGCSTGDLTVCPQCRKGVTGMTRLYF